MNCENSELASIPKEIANQEVKGAEDSRAINAYDCYDYESMQQLRGLLSSKKNNVLSSPADNRYYYTTQADLQRQQNSLTSEQTANSDFDFEQRTEHKLVFPKGEMSTQQQFSPRRSVDENSTSVATTVTSILGCTWGIVTLASSSSLKRKSTPAITEASSSTINSVFAGADNSNWTFSNYGATEEFCGSYPLNSASPLDNPEASLAMDFTSNRLSEAGYSANTPGADMQTESINSVRAHQWHERREKLPAKRDTTFYTEWQINRPPVVNTAEIQKRKLQLLHATADKQLGRVNQRKKNSTPRQTKREKHEEQQQQQHHLYRLQQAQQQNHLRSLTPDSLSSSRHFAHSPLSLNSSTASKQQQTFPCNHSEQTQTHEALLPSSDNSSYDFAAQQQQQLLMHALQQQYLQQLLIQHYQPDFFEKLQELHQQRYHEALQENMSRHQSAHSSRQVSKKRKRQQQHAPQEIANDKENASENLSEAALVIDESAIVSSNVQLQDSKRDDDSKSKHSNVEEQVQENVIANLAEAKKLSDEKSLKSDKSKGERSTASSLELGGVWLNNFERLQNWLETQKQNFVQNESGAVQWKMVYENSDTK